MKHSRNALLLVMSVSLALFLVACGSSTNSGGSSGRYGAGGESTSTPSGAALSIKTAALSISGKSMMVLTTAQGLTLYYRTTDTPTSVCSGGCASAWPPLLSKTMPSVSTTLPGTFSLMSDANGSQVAYNGHPLYTYSGDSAPGQANGEGFGNIWFAAPTTLTAGSTPSVSSTPTPGGYHYP